MPINRRRALRLLAVCTSACVFATALAVHAAASKTVYPLASPIGLVPPAGMQASTQFRGFEDRENNVFIRLVALPADAYSEIAQSMTADTLRKQGMTVEKRESLALAGGEGVLVIVRQQADAVLIRKWLLVAPLGEVTALVSFETPAKRAGRYPEKVIRAALASVTARASVPDAEKLALLPFQLNELAGMRLVQVVPGVAAQLTDGPNDAFEGAEQPHVVIAMAPGGPRQPADYDRFARQSFTGLPPFKDIRLLGSESMRIGGQSGHELRAEAKDAKTGEEVVIVQWLRFGPGAHLRILAFGPKENWTQTFTRLRAVRDGVSPR
jgi:hypothetical protein